ncbi:MAG: peptidylprolyl isomerase [Phycisphaeraceae bacterium]|nr:MAG: peptidylprolyl isomerase [Phycisphaeraceae bacterium]
MRGYVGGGFTIGAAALFAAGCASADAGDGTGPVPVRMTTSLGVMTIELDRERAPVSVANFLAYADRGHYDGTIIHRVVRGFVAQGGQYGPDFSERPAGPPIVNEWTNGLKNLRGTIAMPRDTDPDSATCQFFINLADNARLDIARDVSGGAGYAVFGRVTGGLDVLDAINAVETRPRPGADDLEFAAVPVTPIVVHTVERVRR